MEATSSPPPGASPVATTIPWEDPARISTFERFVETVKLLATRPSEAFAGMPTTGGIGSPLLYAIIVGWIGIAVAVVWNTLFQGMWIPFMGSGEEAAIAAGFTAAWAVGADHPGPDLCHHRCFHWSGHSAPDADDRRRRHQRFRSNSSRRLLCADCPTCRDHPLLWGLDLDGLGNHSLRLRSRHRPPHDPGQGSAGRRTAGCPVLCFRGGNPVHGSPGRSRRFSVTTRPASREERHLAFLWLAAAVSVLALRPLWMAIAPLLRPCVFRSLTGVPCPTCGTTRAATAFLDGNLLAAFAANPLAAAMGLLFVVGAPIATLWAIAQWPLPLLPTPLPRWVRIGAVAVIAGNWLYVISVG